jgi:hypothetical protein
VKLRAVRLVLAATATCVPALGPGDSRLTSVRILAVRADPAEAAPGARVTFTSFVAGPDGTVTGAPAVWSFCTAPKPLTEDNVVSNACLGSSDALLGMGTGPTVTAPTPGDGCMVFGPDTGAPSLRPHDPDGTGGYYQPLRVDLDGNSAIALARIHCDPANADAASVTAFASAYVLNENPQLLPLNASIAGAPVPLTAIPAGARVTLKVGWPAASAETFAIFDAAAQVVSTQREGMQVAWYASDGSLDTESTGRADDDPETTSDNGWNAPSAPGTVHLGVVLRDSRGGVDFAGYDVVVVE